MTKLNKIIFIDRDGTIIVEPPDTKQVNGLEQLAFLPNAISSLRKLYEAGYHLVIVSNQDGLGSKENPTKNFELVNNKMFEILQNEGIKFTATFVCPHLPEDYCSCRKPKTELVNKFIIQNPVDIKNSFVIGDRQTDIIFAKNLGLKGFLINEINNWENITNKIINKPRIGQINRKTNETNIEIIWNLDGSGKSKIKTGLGFFNHMLENFAKHGGFDLEINCQGDLEIDEHHTIEDIGLALGECFAKAIGNKQGINRFSSEKIFPMDEAKSEISLDISGRPFLVFDAKFNREFVGDFPTEMLKHFFQSFCEKASLNLNIKLTGENTHHQIEIAFKSLGRVLRDAVKIINNQIPSTKGSL